MLCENCGRTALDDDWDFDKYQNDICPDCQSENIINWD